MKAFRALSSGEDDELTTAYARFHRAVAREEGVIRNATFVVVNQLSKASAQNNRFLVEKTERVEKLLLSIMHDSRINLEI